MAYSSSLLGTYLDSGVPEGSTDYTTLVVIHGYGFHAGNFKKLVPYAPKYNTRIVLVNRRDYPGAAPFSEEERATLAALATAPAGSPDAVKGTEEFMKERAHELHDYLVALIKDGDVVRPSTDGQKGGLVVVGWSLGAVFISALLAHATSFPVGDVRLSEYIRRLVFYDASYVCHGYQIPQDLYHPLHDPLLSPEERIGRFATWVASYYAHGELSEGGIAALESRNGLKHPPPTTATMSPEELSESTYGPPGEVGGSEQLLVQASIAHGTYTSLRRGAFILGDDLPDGTDDWRKVELRYLWCDRSTWEMTLARWTLANELEEERRAGRKVRDVNWVRFRGGNHFAHWDLPEKTLRAFVGGDKEVE